MKSIPLPCGREVLVDDADYNSLSRYRWWYSGKGYARRTERNATGRTTFYMHRELMQCPDHLQVDHVNGNGLDNRRKNLRICTRSQNGSHRTHVPYGVSGYLGIAWRRDRSKWQATITVDHRTVYLGIFVDLCEAVRIRDEASSRMCGVFAANKPRIQGGGN